MGLPKSILLPLFKHGVYKFIDCTPYNKFQDIELPQQLILRNDGLIYYNY